MRQYITCLSYLVIGLLASSLGCGDESEPIDYYAIYADLDSGQEEDIPAVEDDLATASDSSEVDTTEEVDLGEEADTTDDADTTVVVDTSEVDIGPAVLGGCDEYGGVATHGRLPAVIDEASGMVRASQQGVFWLHNDSGDTANVYAVRAADGLLLRTATLTDVIAIDWEDMTAGPCGGEGRCLYVADFGNNNATRTPVTVHRFPEPDIGGSGPVSAGDIETMALSFPESPFDAEALVVDENGRLYLFSKILGSTSIYFADFAAGEGTWQLGGGPLDLTGLPNTAVENITGADYDTEERTLLLRTYSSILEFRLAPSETLLDFADLEYRLVPHGIDEKGEAVAYDGTGSYWHVSEGNSVFIFEVPCEDEM